MKPVLAIVGVAWLLAGAHAAEERFSRSLRAEDFAAAGLGKLSPEELARLDDLVRAQQRAPVAESRILKAPQPAAAARTDATARAPAARAADNSSIVLPPGTQVEYSTLESRLAGEFQGWKPRTIFTLENGQRWQVTSSQSYVSPPIANPKVTIAPGMLGVYWMTIEGVRTRVKVQPLGGRP